MPNLEELYVSHNGIKKMTGFEHLKKLKVLDLAGNAIEEVEGADQLPALEDLWLNNNAIKSLDSLAILQNNANLRTLYIEQNPATVDGTCTAVVKGMLPQLTQIDADEV